MDDPHHFTLVTLRLAARHRIYTQRHAWVVKFNCVSVWVTILTWTSCHWVHFYVGFVYFDISVVCSSSPLPIIHWRYVSVIVVDYVIPASHRYHPLTSTSSISSRIVVTFPTSESSTTPPSPALASPLPVIQRSSVSSTDTDVVYSGIAFSCHTAVNNISYWRRCFLLWYRHCLSDFGATCVRMIYISNTIIVYVHRRCLWYQCRYSTPPLSSCHRPHRLDTDRQLVTCVVLLHITWLRFPAVASSAAFNQLATCLARINFLCVIFICLLLLSVFIVLLFLLDSLLFIVFLTFTVIFSLTIMFVVVFLSCLVLILRISPPMSLLFHTFITSPSIAYLLLIFLVLISSPLHSQVSFSIAAAILLLKPGTFSFIFLFYLKTSQSWSYSTCRIPPLFLQCKISLLP